MGGIMSDWSLPVRLAELARGPARFGLRPGEAECARIAADLGLVRLSDLDAQLETRPWLDGAEISGRFTATVTQICGITLEPFETLVSGEIDVRVVPAGSPNAPVGSAGEVTLDLEGPEPPDEVEGELVDLAAYVIEHLALEIDPFPRKPDAEFAYAPESPSLSPFAALARLKKPDA